MSKSYRIDRKVVTVDRSMDEENIDPLQQVLKRKRDVLEIKDENGKENEKNKKQNGGLRKRQKGGSTPLTGASTPTVDRSTFEALQEKYNTLKELRYTEVEQLYEDSRKTHKEREKASHLFIEQLKAEKEELIRQIEQLVTVEKPSTEEIHHPEMEKLKNIIHFYETITAFRVEPQNNTIETDAHNKFKCTGQAGRRQITFDLTKDGDFLDYEPTNNQAPKPEEELKEQTEEKDSKQDDWEIPPMFQGAIRFSEQEAPIFTAKLFIALFKKDEASTKRKHSK
eukprot:TRINITY_DN12132_c0_g1_i1.p1 TRINITY_DN12132_c0_g1~~TRINITY_DN12132_c0_g1_i1.p1  ORF type:complete len:282 (-),score=96.19 TRINITY_DN12132_c0_g1_i1:29-874(-)